MGKKIRLPNTVLRFVDDNGDALAGGFLYTYNNNTAVNKTTYQDADGSTPHSNPITLDSRGEAQVYWDGLYSIKVTDSGGTQINNYTQDDVGQGALEDEARTAPQATTHDMASDADYALTTAQELFGRIIITDTSINLTAARNITCSTTERGYYFQNDTAQILTLKTSAGTGVALLAGTATYLVCDGTNVVNPIEVINTLNLPSALNETNGADIASAATTDIGAATGNFVDITGTTTITGLGTVQAGTKRTLQFDGSLTLTYNATSLILPGNADIITQAGDTAEFVSLGSGNWICTNYQSDFGTPNKVRHWGYTIADFAAPSTAPAGVAIDPSTGNLISCDSASVLIYIHDGISSTVSSSFASPSTAPTGVAIDPSTGNLISCDLASDLIYIHDGISSTVSSSFASPSTAPEGVAIDPSTGNLISCDSASDLIYIHLTQTV